jgi:hypothetical protein
MTLVLDAGGLSALAGPTRPAARAARPRALARAGAGGPLVEVLTGDRRRHLHVNALLRACQVREVEEMQGRRAARLRTATGRAGTSGVDVNEAVTRGKWRRLMRPFRLQGPVWAQRCW